MDRHLDIQKNVMKDLLLFINKYDKHTTILKGGTSLMFCYKLDRFSEDIDLDSTNKNIGKLIKEYCTIKKYNFNIKKDTDTVKRFMIEFLENEKIKVEISYRNKNLTKERYMNINGIDVYSIDKIMGMKINAYNSRDKIRDLYDIVFIMKNYKEQIPELLIEQLRDSFQYKGLEQFDYLIKTQDDSLLDKDMLAENLLEIFDDLGLIDNYSSIIERNMKLKNDEKSAEKIEQSKTANIAERMKSAQDRASREYESADNVNHDLER